MALYDFVKQRLRFVLLAGMVIAFSGARLYAGSCCGNGASAPQPEASPALGETKHPRVAESPFQAPHGGQLTKTIWNYFEVVYKPTETRVYAFDMFRSPVRVARVEGQVMMRVRSSGGGFTYPLRYVQPDQGQDYLAASVDLTRVRQGDMDVEINLSSLPNPAEQTTNFSQVFGATDRTDLASAHLPTSVVRAPLRERRGEKECCTSGAGCCKLSAQGVAAESCRGGDQQSTGQTFARGPLGGENSLHRLPAINELPSNSNDRTVPDLLPTKFVVVKTTSADDAAIRIQGICPVTKQPLGSHGPPMKLLIDNHALFVCCQGCVAKVKANPKSYLAMVVSRS